MRLRFVLIAAAALLAACRRPAEQRLPAAGSFPNAPVVIISIDTLRADHLPLFGYKSVQTPHIDALRRDGILFTNAWSHVPLTLPSHTTLLTGLLPAENGVRDNIGYQVRSNGRSLPELLHANGYATGAAVSAYVLRGETGMRSLFDAYDDGIAFQPGVALGEIQRPGTQTAAVARQWIAAHRDKPFFYLLHLFEPHAPYVNGYDGEIATVDGIVGQFLDALKQDGVYDKAIIVLLSDHGEGLGDHGEQEHGILLYRESLHVPLILKLPNGAAANETIDAPAGLIDVLPTIASLTRTQAPAGLRGVPLLQAAAQPRRVFSETMYPRLHLGWSDLRSLADATHHFIDAPKPELYDMRSDPGEKTNVLADQRRVYASFRKDVEQYPRELQQPSHVDPEEAKKLAALGYLTASTTASGPLPDPKEHIGELALYQEALALLDRGDSARAIDALRKLVDTNPNFADALEQLARAYESAGRYAEAVEVCKQVIAKNPAMTEVMALSLGAIYLQLGKYADARAHAELALKRSPGAAHLLLGRIAFAQHDYAGAEREAHTALGDAHFATQAAMLAAESLVKRGRAGEAVALLDSRPFTPVSGFHAGRADALMHANRVDEAIAAFREEIRLFPNNRDAYGNLAAVLLLQGRPQDAMAVLEQLVTANPSRASYDLAADVCDHFQQPAAAAAWRRRGAAAR
jgi:choline-sulfatase